MIKLIASDMDGTLLDQNGRIPEEFPEIVEKLNKAGTRFIVASGRSYVTLKSMFSSMLDKVDFICDNGAYVVLNQKVVKANTIQKDLLHRILNECEKIDGIKIVLCGLNGTYHLKGDNEFAKIISMYYINEVRVDSLYDIDDDIIKVAICDEKNPMENSFLKLSEVFGDELMLAVSGHIWMDIMNKDINKGTALKEIQEIKGVTFDETMAFGDFYNDVELLAQAKYSFVMENANDDMKKHGKYIADSNSKNGVIKAIMKYVK